MICCVRDRNAEALRTQSSCSIVSSAFSASLRFKPPCSRKDGGLDPRVSHSISRVRKTAVGDPRQHAKAGFCLAGGGGMSLAGLESQKRERKVARTQSRKDFELPESPLRLRALAYLHWRISFGDVMQESPSREVTP